MNQNGPYSESAHHEGQRPDSREEPVARLLAIMARLRDPCGGCSWDLEQDFCTIAPYTIEEAYEVADAAERGDMGDLKDELGDLLLQVVYHARIAQERGLFDFDDVATAIAEKLVRRHPHVFGSPEARSGNAAPQWDAIKQSEKAARAGRSNAEAQGGLFDEIPRGLPALPRSAKLQKRARAVGFDWSSLTPLLGKVDEEWAELRAEIDAGPGKEAERRRFEEFGDLLFVLVNAGLHLGIDAECALRSANQKFIRRTESMELAARAGGRELQELSTDEMESLWQDAKSSLR